MVSNIDIYATGKPTQFGMFGYYGLLNWWNSEFTNQQRIYVTQKYHPMGGDRLTSGQMLGCSASAVNFLTGMQSWFTNLSDESISQKILTKAEELISPKTTILDIHFLYGAFIAHYYKKRKQDLFYDLAKKYCLKQIDLAVQAKSVFMIEFGFLPGHKGYEQLAIILDKEHNFIAALQLCQNAKNEGWNSDWDKRISKLETKLNKE